MKKNLDFVTYCGGIKAPKLVLKKDDGNDKKSKNKEKVPSVTEENEMFMKAAMKDPMIRKKIGAEMERRNKGNTQQ